MDACDGFEIAIEMRLHGAADGDAATRLDTHLATCAACREFEASARRVEDTMRSETQQIAADIDWARLRARVNKINREYRLLPLVLLVSTVLAVAMFLAVRPSPVLPAVAFCSVVLLFLTYSLRRSAERLREARRAEQTQEGLLTYCRQELDERIRRLSMGWLVAPLSAVPLLFLTTWIPQRAHAPASLLTLADVILPLFFVGLGFYARFVQLPRTRREREELS